MAAQVADILARIGRVDLDRIAVDRREFVAAGREPALPAHLDGKLLVRADIVHQEVHKAELIGEAGEDV